MERFAFWKKKQSLLNLLLAWLLAATLEYALLPYDCKYLGGLEGLQLMSLPRLLAVTAAGYIFLTCFLSESPRSRWILVAFFALYATPCVIYSGTATFKAACLFVSAPLLCYALRGQDLSPLPEPVKLPESPPTSGAMPDGFIGNRIFPAAVRMGYRANTLL